MDEHEAIQALGDPLRIRRHSWGAVSLDYPNGVVVIVHTRGNMQLAVENPTLDQCRAVLAHPEVLASVKSLDDAGREAMAEYGRRAEADLLAKIRNPDA